MLSLFFFFPLLPYMKAVFANAFLSSENSGSNFVMASEVQLKKCF